MDTVRLGRTGLRVSRLCLGTMNFGPRTSEADSHAILDRALELGIPFLDTADVYGGKAGEGVTEQILGRWFAKGGGRRRQAILATKVYNRMGPGPNDRGLSARHIRLACEDSLRRLQTDYIDLYQMHHVDRSTPWEEIWQAMELLVRQGKVLYVGSSNFGALHIVQAQAAAVARNFLGLVSEQSLYNLTARTIELEVMPACRESGLGILPWSPLAGGLLGGAASGPGGRRDSDRTRERARGLAPQLQAYETLCAELGEPPARVALAWTLRRPEVVAPIIGPRTLAQLEDSVGAAELRLPDDALKALDELFPGPGGEAPEAYAW